MSRLRMGMGALGLAVGLALLVGPNVAAEQRGAPPAPAGPILLMVTSKGDIEIEVSLTDAPKSAEHILNLVRRNFYRGQRIHWAPPAAVQFGDPASRDVSRQDTWGGGGSGKSIGVAETSSRRFERGSVGVFYEARQNPILADSQLFILRVANPSMNGKYAYIGRVTKGMDVVDKLAVRDVIRSFTIKPAE